MTFPIAPTPSFDEVPTAAVCCSSCSEQRCRTVSGTHLSMSDSHCTYYSFPFESLPSCRSSEEKAMFSTPFTSTNVMSLSSDRCSSAESLGFSSHFHSHNTRTAIFLNSAAGDSEEQQQLLLAAHRQQCLAQFTSRHLAFRHLTSGELDSQKKSKALGHYLGSRKRTPLIANLTNSNRTCPSNGMQYSDSQTGFVSHLKRNCRKEFFGQLAALYATTALYSRTSRHPSRPPFVAMDLLRVLLDAFLVPCFPRVRDTQLGFSDAKKQQGLIEYDSQITADDMAQGHFQGGSRPEQQGLLFFGGCEVLSVEFCPDEYCAVLTVKEEVDSADGNFDFSRVLSSAVKKGNFGDSSEFASSKSSSRVRIFPVLGVPRQTVQREAAACPPGLYQPPSHAIQQLSHATQPHNSGVFESWTSSPSRQKVRDDLTAYRCHSEVSSRSAAGSSIPYGSGSVDAHVSVLQPDVRFSFAPVCADARDVDIVAVFAFDPPLSPVRGMIGENDSPNDAALHREAWDEYPWRMPYLQKFCRCCFFMGSQCSFDAPEGPVPDSYPSGFRLTVQDFPTTAWHVSTPGLNAGCEQGQQQKTQCKPSARHRSAAVPYRSRRLQQPDCYLAEHVRPAAGGGGVDGISAYRPNNASRLRLSCIATENGRDTLQSWKSAAAAVSMPRRPATPSSRSGRRALQRPSNRCSTSKSISTARESKNAAGDGTTPPVKTGHSLKCGVRSGYRPVPSSDSVMTSSVSSSHADAAIPVELTQLHPLTNAELHRLQAPFHGLDVDYETLTGMMDRIEPLECLRRLNAALFVAHRRMTYVEALDSKQ